MRLEHLDTNQLCEMRGQVRSNVSALEKKKQFRTVEETHVLAEQRALLRNLTRIIKTRIVQKALF